MEDRKARNDRCGSNAQARGFVSDSSSEGFCDGVDRNLTEFTLKETEHPHLDISDMSLSMSLFFFVTLFFWTPDI